MNLLMWNCDLNSCTDTILGTFTEHGGGLFWHLTTKLPLQANPIICWKFCHVLHKLLREGHQNVSRYQKLSKYDQEIPQSHTADQPMAPGGRATEHL